MSGHAKPKLLVLICVLTAAAIAFRAQAQPVPSPAVQSPTPGPPAAAAAETAPGCKTLAKASAGGASVVQAAEESLQHKSWQAEGGEIQFAVKSLVAIPADASVVVCFRWQSKSESKADFIEKLPSRLELSSDGKLLKVTTAVPSDLGPKPSDVATALPLVPLAEVRILAIDNKKKELAADASTAIGITYPLGGLILALAAVALGFGVLYIAVVRRVTHPGILQANWLLRIISTPSGFASLSQFQIVLWTFVVAASAVYVMSLSGQLIQITNGMLVLLGIAGLAGIGAKAHSEALGASAEATAATAAAAKAAADIEAAQKAAEAAVPPTDPVAAARVAAANNVAATQAAAQGAIAAATKARANALKDPPPNQIPRWSDLIVNESIKDDGTRTREIDVARFQMLLFTLITAVFVLMNVITTYVIPEISTGFQTLLGISNGVYMGSKIVQRS
ncbi:MAG: hypothetical protein E6G81_11515 [Alphaproteobacteria bacterium]|nr:MAG: hypothetical protein E6G81_11515 [Alphaproteobacteria bacterium]